MPHRKSGSANDPCPVRSRASAAPCISRPVPTIARTTPSLDRPTGGGSRSPGSVVRAGYRVRRRWD